MPAHKWLMACLDGTVGFVGEPLSSNNCGFKSSDSATIHAAQYTNTYREVILTPGFLPQRLCAS